MESLTAETKGGTEAQTVGEAVRAWCRGGQEQARRTKEAALQAAVDGALAKVLGQPRGKRNPALSPWACPRCGERRGDQLRRNGHYRRQVLIVEGVVHMRMPQLVCVDCRKSVPVSHPLIAPRQRIGPDIEQHIACLYLEGCSYRATRRLLERDCRSSIGLMSIWRRFQSIGRRPHKVPTHPPSRYLFLDEVYHKVRGKGRWLLCVRGRDEQGGLHWIGFAVSEDRSQAAWEAALDELGISRYNPPFAVVSDGDRAIEEALKKCLPGVKLYRCTWHLKHNAAEWIRERYPRAEDEGQRKGLMAAVHSIVDAPSLSQRAESMAVLRDTFSWLADALARALDRIPVRSDEHPIRTNNAMERGFREQRRRTRPMDGFGSDDGIKNFIFLWMLKENARVNGRDFLPELVA